MPTRRRTILVAGATGYVGGRLVPKLLESGHTVRVLVRNAARARRHDWSDRVEVVVGDVLDPDTLTDAFAGCDAAYYLVHSIGSGGGDGFAETEARSAEHFRDAADAADLDRIVYLGGMGGTRDGGMGGTRDGGTGGTRDGGMGGTRDGGMGGTRDGGMGGTRDGAALSEHLASRHRVGEILASGRTPTTELRAAVVIGSGSLSFEMLRYLTEVLPVMVTPSWVRTRCQPIAIRDVLHYLVGVLDDDEPIDRVLEIGGPDVVTYADMMQTFASVAGLPHRVIVPVPLLSPRLSSRWVGLVTPLPARAARPLIDSLRHEVVMHDHTIDELVPHDPLPFRESLELAVRRTRAEAVDTRWTDAGFTPADSIPGDPEWSGGTIFTDEQTVATSATDADLYEAFARIGGANGYYVADWAWWVRGLADKVIGGPGLRRGRRHPVDLRAGESLDFWRVVNVEVDHELVLEAEMKVPGKAWLTWRIEESPDDTECPRQLHQVAFFAPKGLFGRAYWFAMLPFHWLIFKRMAHAIVAHAEDRRAATPTAAPDPPARA